MSVTLDSYLETHHTIPGVLARSHGGRNAKGGLFHTPREIGQQPFLWRHTAQMLSGQAAALRAFIEAAGLYRDHDRPGLILTGAGTSDYVGLSLCDLLRTRFRTPVVNWSTTRITATPDLFFNDLQHHIVIHFARSGDSPESRAVLDFALKYHHDTVRHIVITCNGEGVLARIAMEHPENVFLILLHEASNDKALAMTSSFSNMVIAGQALAHLDDMDGFRNLVDRMAMAA